MIDRGSKPSLVQRSRLAAGQSTRRSILNAWLSKPSGFSITSDVPNRLSRSGRCFGGYPLNREIRSAHLCANQLNPEQKCAAPTQHEKTLCG